LKGWWCEENLGEGDQLALPVEYYPFYRTVATV